MNIAFRTPPAGSVPPSGLILTTRAQCQPLQSFNPSLLHRPWLLLPHTVLVLMLAVTVLLVGQSTTAAAPATWLTNASSLPPAPLDSEPHAQVDWLVTVPPTHAAVYRGSTANELVLDNGLARRTFRLGPNAATVGLDNLDTDEALLRSVRPEAVVELNGQRFNIGGLIGQPIHNFLKREWLDTMRADPAAWRCTGFAAGPTEARFPWKPRREWLSTEAVWPPPGVQLTFEFAATSAALETGAAESNVPREMLLEDAFKTLSPDWEVHTSTTSPRSSFQNEGKPGEIMAGENTAVFAERKLPPGVKVVQCLVDPGTDRSASWGPGLTLVWPNRVVKFYLRPGKEELGLNDNGGESYPARIDPAQAYWLRVRIAPHALFCAFSTNGVDWKPARTLQLDPPLGDPVAVRLGKTSRTGGADDFSEPGELARCQVSHFSAFGDIKRDPSAPRPALADVRVQVHYELYDGLPLLAKWLTVHNQSSEPVRLDSFVVEQLAVVEPESIVDGNPQNFRGEFRDLEAFSDYAFGGNMTGNADAPGVRWKTDPLYTTQVHYLRETPCLLEGAPPLGPAVDVPPGKTFESFRVFELLHDSTCRERRGLAVRRAYRALAPWVQENPVLMHVRSARPDAVKLAIDQCADVGFEMVIMTFGSGFNVENESPDYLAQIKSLADYAHKQGIELGGYSLLASRRINDEQDVINPETGHTGGARFGNSPCLGSQWGQDYFRKLRQFFETTGCGILEHDGSYPGDVCASTNHPGHHGLNDSQWTQWKVISDFYKWCRGRGIYLNVPDWYYLSGSTKCGMGYRESNWSLPRDEQEIIERQNVFDGTWEKTPSMGWMFVPLVQYHGGGAAATIEPLKDHLAHYESRLANLFGAGVQACYRGPRLLTHRKPRAVVKRWVDFYKLHRAILDSDLIHLRRPDGRDWDGWLHVNPKLPRTWTGDALQSAAPIHHASDYAAAVLHRLDQRRVDSRSRRRSQILFFGPRISRDGERHPSGEGPHLAGGGIAGRPAVSWETICLERLRPLRFHRGWPARSGRGAQSKRRLASPGYGKGNSSVTSPRRTLPCLAKDFTSFT